MASSPIFPALHCCGILFFSVLLLFFPSQSHGQKVPALYVFGDSLVDVGNNNYLPRSGKANFPHNGIDYPGGKATGRFSNGKNAADFLAEKLALPTSLPYLSLTSSPTEVGAFLKGINFASGGAGVLSTTNKGRCLTLDKQIKLFSKVHRALVKQLGSDETLKHLSQSPFLLAIGNNDLLVYFGFNSSQISKASAQQFVDSLVFTLKGQLRRMYKLGARKIVFLGPMPVGCCPSVRRNNKNEECNMKSNHGVIMFNEGVSALLRGMKSELGDMSYSVVDAYVTLMEYIQKPSTYGFAEVKAACCGLGILNADVGCLPAASYCSNRRDHVFWDFYHPTEAVTRLLSNAIFDGSWPYVHPINVRQLMAL